MNFDEIIRISKAYTYLYCVRKWSYLLQSKKNYDQKSLQRFNMEKIGKICFVTSNDVIIMHFDEIIIIGEVYTYLYCVQKWSYLLQSKKSYDQKSLKSLYGLDRKH